MSLTSAVTPSGVGRRTYVVGNWKMYTTPASAIELASAVASGVGGEDRVEVVVCPPFPYLAAVGQVLHGSKVKLGAQNCYHEQEGAFTGEVSPAMLAEMGCDYVILGHSERRRILGESSSFIHKKVFKAVEAGLKVIVCAGETKAERDAGQAHAVVEEQLRESLKDFPRDRLDRLILAYEPVWAIGTGVNATPQQAQDMHVYVRQKGAAAVGEAKAREVSILYGGSVKPDNAADLLAQPDVDGVLVGGASLKDDQFLAIVRAAGAIR
jgi:triosephosphate isomerase